MTVGLYYAGLASALGLVVILWRNHARTRRLLAEDDLAPESALATDNSFLDIGPNIFASEDCDFIQQETPPSFTRKFREERTALALAWLRRARRSANRLMSLHAQAARSRADLRASGEVQLVLEFISFHIALGVLYCAVSLRGPFHVAALARYSVSLAGRIKQSAGELATGAAPLVS